MTEFPNSCWGILFSLCTFLYGSYGPLVKLSQVDGKLEYSTSEAVFINELIKFFIAALMCYTTAEPHPVSLRELLKYFIPAACYFFNNNSSFYILTYMDAASFSVLSNLKVLSTTILYRLFMKRFPNKKQCVALILLVCGSLLHSYGSLDTKNESSLDEMRVSPAGVILLVVSVTLTSFAAVFTEYTMKKQQQMSIHQQNMYMYTAGIFFNGCAILGSLSPKSDSTWRPFDGFNVYTWMVILTTVLQGFCVSYVMKYSSNITRLVLTCASLLVSTALSVLIFRLQMSFYFLLSAVLIVIALVIYSQGSTLQVKSGSNTQTLVKVF